MGDDVHDVYICSQHEQHAKRRTPSNYGRRWDGEREDLTTLVRDQQLYSDVIKREQRSSDSIALAVLDEIERKPRVSQRELANLTGVSLGLVNRLLGALLAKRYLEIAEDGARPFKYRVTLDGQQYRRELVHHQYRSVVNSVKEIQARILRGLRELAGKGVTRVVFYGAGEVMELTKPLAESAGFDILGIVDDNPKLQGSTKAGFVVQTSQALRELSPDAVVVTTFRYAGHIETRLKQLRLGRVVVWEL